MHIGKLGTRPSVSDCNAAERCVARQMPDGGMPHGSWPQPLRFVPTMGALHEGHLSLVRRSRAENDRTVVSIFVNPAQFDDHTDLAQYPRTLEADLGTLRGEGANFVFLPREPDLYPDGYRYRVTEFTSMRGPETHGYTDTRIH